MSNSSNNAENTTNPVTAGSKKPTESQEIWGIQPESMGSWQTLPRSVEFCSAWRELVGNHGYLAQWATRLNSWTPVDMAQVTWAPLTDSPTHLFCDARIDGANVLIGFSETGLLKQPGWRDMTLVVAAQPWHEHHPRLCPFPTPGWITWAEYSGYMSMEVPGYDIVARMHSSNVDRPGRKVRRDRLVAQLQAAFGERVHSELLPRGKHLNGLCRAAMVVHTGGAFANSWDRTSAEAFSLCKVLIQPEIFTLVGPTRPIAGKHYLACRDDMSDVCDLAQWVLDEPAKAAAIGSNAYKFWLTNLAPTSMWRRIYHRLQICLAERAAALAAQEATPKPAIEEQGAS